MKTRLLFVLTLALVLFGHPAFAQVAQDRVKAILHEHPEILLDVLREHGKEVLDILEQEAKLRQRELLRKQFAAKLTKPLTPEIGPKRPHFGPENAPVTIVEYTDFLCPFCSQAARSVEELLKRHPKDIRLVLKHFATGKLGTEAALYFESVYLQDPAKAKSFHDQIFANYAEVAQKGDLVLKDLAKAVGADMNRLAQDVKNKGLTERIQDDIKEAHKFGFEGTPTFLINGVVVRGAVPLDILEEDVQVAKQAALSGKHPQVPLKNNK
jgi:protein-disulfide isomerase